MFFILSKVLVFLLSPLVWIFLLMIWGLKTTLASRKKKCYLAAFFLLVFFTNPFLKNQVYQAWEPAPIELQDTFDIAIVLGGFTDINAYPIHRNNFNNSIERLTQTLELYHQGLVKKILLTGGNSNIIYKDSNESKEVLRFLLRIGIPREDIIIEAKARNTYENALFTKELLGNQNAKLLLTTSAFHLYRSKQCFDKIGLQTTAYPVDYIQAPFKWSLGNTILPSPIAINHWQMLIKEWIGIVVYKMKGYL